MLPEKRGCRSTFLAEKAWFKILISEFNNLSFIYYIFRTQLTNHRPPITVHRHATKYPLIKSETAIRLHSNSNSIVKTEILKELLFFDKYTAETINAGKSPRAYLGKEEKLPDSVGIM